MKQPIAIALATFLELRRQKLLLVPIIALVLSLLGLAAAVLLTLDDMESNDWADAAFWMTGVAMAGATLYAIIIGSTLIAREISHGTLLMLGARPIGRSAILAGRVLGATVFLTMSVVLVTITYAAAFALVSGSLEPVLEPAYAALVGAPAVLLGLVFGTACSVQGRSTAAIGTAMAISAFALAAGLFSIEWRAEQRTRSYLTDEVRELLPSNAPAVGPTASLVARILPFGALAAHGAEVGDSRNQDYPAYREKRIDTRADSRGNMYAGYAGPPPAMGQTGVPEPRKLPDDPDDQAVACAQYGNASCFLGYDNAWKQRFIPNPDYRLGTTRDLLLAWLAIPLWALIAAGLFVRRRDLS